MCNKDESWFIIIKNYSTFQLEIVEATVDRVTENEIILEKQRSALISDVWTFQKSEYGKSIFASFDEAKYALDHWPR
jgi:hypothetical protein